MGEMYAVPFTIERGRAALAAILSAFETPPHLARISLAKQEAGNSMIRYQQVVFPLCTEIQLSVIAQFGFQPDGEGIIQVESLSRRSLAHEARPPLTHVTALSLDSAEDPELVGETEILDTDLVRSLSENLPSRLIGSDWRQIYSTSSHGFSLSSFYRRCSTSTSGPTLLCIRDIDDNIFGALVSSPIVISEHFYGTGETFLFTATPRFRMFKWSGENPHFARGNVNHFTVGAGEGQFGLWLDSSLCQGRTQACSTYNNPPLVGDEEAGGGDFVVKTIECWAFD